MQINSSPHIQPQVQTAEADLLKALGQNLEGAQNGELTGEAGQEVDFAGLLAEELEEKPSKEENIKPEEKVLEQKTPEQKIPSELSQIIGTQKTPVVAADKEIVAKENPQTLVKNPATTPSEIAPKSIAANVPAAEAEVELPAAGLAATKKAQAVEKVETKAQDQGKLLNLQEFMGKQSAGTQKRMGEQVYAAQVQKSMFADKIQKSHTPSLDISLAHSDVMKSALNNEMAQVDRNMDLGAQFFNQNKETSTGTGADTKAVLDMGKTDLGADAAKVLDQVKNYIIQSKVSNNPQVEMSFKHDQLGMVDLLVKKTDGHHMSITITTNSAEGAKFFSGNQGELLASLAHSGVKVSEFKLDNQTSGDSSKGFAQHGQNGSDQSANNQRNEDAQRRRELWDLMRQKEAA